MFRLFAIQDFSINLYIVSVSCKETEIFTQQIFFINL